MIDALAAKTPLRVDRTTAIDTMWILLDPHLYEELTTRRGWNHEQYTEWLADTQRRLLLP